MVSNFNQKELLLTRTLSRLLPDIFFHPLWNHFDDLYTDLHSSLIPELLRPAQKLLLGGDLNAACQILLVCAALEKRIGDMAAALTMARQAWTLAEFYNQPDISRWAAWGASALCANLGNFAAAHEHLDWLRDQLSKDNDWVLANIVEMIQETLDRRVRDNDDLGLALDWLLRWGESPHDIEASDLKFRPPDAGRPASTQAKTTPWWRSLLKTIQLLSQGRLRIKLVEADSLMGDRPVQDPHTFRLPPPLLQPSLPNLFSKEQPAREVGGSASAQGTPTTWPRRTPPDEAEIHALPKTESQPLQWSPPSPPPDEHSNSDSRNSHSGQSPTHADASAPAAPVDSPQSSPAPSVSTAPVPVPPSQPAPPQKPTLAPETPQSGRQSADPAGKDIPALTIYCLGHFQVYRDEKMIENWASRKAQSILKYLAAHHPTPISKDQIMELFWPESEPESARRNLHQAIYALRQVLKSDTNDFQYILFENDCYLINPSARLWMDYIEFERHVSSGRQLEQDHSLDQAMVEYSIAEGIYHDDFLAEDAYEDWPQPRRLSLWQTYLQVAYRLARHYLEVGEYTAVVALSRRILSRDPAQEEAHQNLMLCYLAQGQRQPAISQYQICVKALRTELGISPSAATQALYKKIVSS